MLFSSVPYTITKTTQSPAKYLDISFGSAFRDNGTLFCSALHSLVGHTVRSFLAYLMGTLQIKRCALIYQSSKHQHLTLSSSCRHSSMSGSSGIEKDQESLGRHYRINKTGQAFHSSKFSLPNFSK